MIQSKQQLHQCSLDFQRVSDIDVDVTQNLFRLKIYIQTQRRK